MIPYQLALSIASVVLAAAYAADRDAPVAARIVIASIAVATILTPLPNTLAWQVGTILTQLTICLFVLLRRIARRV